MKDEIDDGKARLAELESRLAETAAVAEGVQIELNGQLAFATADLRTSSAPPSSPCPSPAVKSSSATLHASVEDDYDSARQVGDEVRSGIANAQVQQDDLLSPTDEFENETDSATQERNGSMGDSGVNSSIASLSERINDRMCQEGRNPAGRSSVAHGLIHDISAANPDTPGRRRSTRPGAKKPAVYVRESSPFGVYKLLHVHAERLPTHRTKMLTLNCGKSTIERSRYLPWRASLLNWQQTRTANSL